MRIKCTFLFSLFFFFSFAQNEFITIWKPNATGINKNMIYFYAYCDNYKIYWEEVGNTSHNGTLTHVNSTPVSPKLIDFGPGLTDDARYIVKVSDVINGFSYENRSSYNNDGFKLYEIKQWGNINWTNMYTAFYNCGNMDVTATDSPNLSNVTNMAAMFYNCHFLIGNNSFSLWDTSNITNMSSMFQAATRFNQNIGNWNTSKVTNMENSFYDATNFNQNIANWDTSNVTNMSNMFKFAASFNQDISNWNTSKVSSMYWMFTGATTFNQNIGNWNTSKVTDMSNMFGNASSFNQNIGNWNTSNVTNMQSMFYEASNFNQNIGNWDTSKVVDMRFMFAFNNSFDQSLENWNLKSLKYLDYMFHNSKISCQSYNKTLIGWAYNPNTPNNLQFTNNDNVKYSTFEALTARAYLLNTKGWFVSGDQYNPSCALATEENNINKIQVYPNPAKDFILIENLKNNTDLEIYDMQGKLVKKEKYKNNQISLKNLSKGIYILKIPSQKYVQKIIIE